MSNPFTDEAIAAIKRHMNDDHADDALLIVRALGGRPAATAAITTNVDGEAIYFEVDGDEVRIPWSTTLSERAQVRTEVVKLYEQACSVLGVPTRGSH
ncbi:hypothetical protein Aph01nite_73570 [Acrocarpospora phusangensis]|uniref:DUF2470 domain-containing protein n=1 Tax=Acrocarpospora phusangensis TaxID=1070424 RepID=A0A919QHH9_9ACTN|nr:DUF2470 domain-containing protein [Acrocarpospora phusangensis]GIH29047.1 hypothetical protein Aph01nite_73570 [Acrocarpospora phusangensis]